MPKNAHSPRGGGAKKPKPASGSVPESVDKGGKKGTKEDGKSAKQTTQSSSSTQEKGKGAPEAEPPKKPDVRTLIGGASWTGKLPVNMLSEHCQKQLWAKPDYRMVCYKCL